MLDRSVATGSHDQAAVPFLVRVDLTWVAAVDTAVVVLGAGRTADAEADREDLDSGGLGSSSRRVRLSTSVVGAAVTGLGRAVRLQGDALLDSRSSVCAEVLLRHGDRRVEVRSRRVRIEARDRFPDPAVRVRDTVVRIELAPGDGVRRIGIFASEANCDPLGEIARIGEEVDVARRRLAHAVDHLAVKGRARGGGASSRAGNARADGAERHPLEGRVEYRGPCWRRPGCPRCSRLLALMLAVRSMISTTSTGMTGD